jgi:hypothetical protein
VGVVLNGGIRAIQVFEVCSQLNSSKTELNQVYAKSSRQNDAVAKELAEQLKRASQILLRHHKDYADRPHARDEAARRIGDFRR